MASNRLPDSRDSLTLLAQTAADGAKRQAAAIGLQHNTETAIRADLEALRTQGSAYLSARAECSKATRALAATCTDGRKWLLMARDILKTFLGSKPGKLWKSVGWPDHSTAVPRTDAEIAFIVDMAGKYLTDHPEREVPNLNFTAARAVALFTSLREARSARNARKAARTQAKQERAAAERKLRRRMRGLVGELDQLVDSRDPKWRSFGLKCPGAPDSPAKVKNTRTEAVGNARVLVRCAAAARAEYYQVHAMIVGKDTEFALLESPRDPQKMLEGLPVGATVRLKMRAMNETGHGPFGEIAEVVVK